MIIEAVARTLIWAILLLLGFSLIVIGQLGPGVICIMCGLIFVILPLRVNDES